jgi:hypothetical protein
MISCGATMRPTLEVASRDVSLYNTAKVSRPSGREGIPLFDDLLYKGTAHLGRDIHSFHPPHRGGERFILEGHTEPAREIVPAEMVEPGFVIDPSPNWMKVIRFWAFSRSRAASTVSFTRPWRAIVPS